MGHLDGRVRLDRRDVQQLRDRPGRRRDRPGRRLRAGLPAEPADAHPRDPDPAREDPPRRDHPPSPGRDGGRDRPRGRAVRRAGSHRRPGRSASGRPADDDAEAASAAADACRRWARSPIRPALARPGGPPLDARALPRRCVGRFARPASTCAATCAPSTTCAISTGRCPTGSSPERFEVVVNLLSLERRQRVRLRVQVPESDPVVPTLFNLYPGTENMEREAFDMFGIAFRRPPRPDADPHAARTGRATRCARTTRSGACRCSSRKRRAHDERRGRHRHELVAETSEGRQELHERERDRAPIELAIEQGGVLRAARGTGRSTRATSTSSSATTRR